MASRLFLLSVLLALCVVAHAAPFFDAIYDAINGNTRRSYGYSGYGNYDYTNYGYNGYQGYPRNTEKEPRQGKTYKDICRVHFPDSIAVPGAGGIVCPY